MTMSPCKLKTGKRVFNIIQFSCIDSEFSMIGPFISLIEEIKINGECITCN